MSTIAVDNARPSAGGTSYSLTSGVAKSWANFNGTGTVAIREDLNVSSLTDNGTGNYRINYSNALGSSSYSVAGIIGGTSGTPRDLFFPSASPPTTGNTSFYTTNSSEGLFDCEIVCAQTCGDLA
jgi:hypothetical protein